MLKRELDRIKASDYQLTKKGNCVQDKMSNNQQNSWWARNIKISRINAISASTSCANLLAQLVEVGSTYFEHKWAREGEIRMKLNKAILRIFEVRAKPGQVEKLQQKLSSTSISVVDGKPGNLGYFFGKNVSTDGDDLVFISIWQDLDAVKSRFGEQWEESFLPEGYEELIEHCSITHVEFDGRLNL